MANYDSSLTGAQIESALEAVHGLIVPANNGKIICVDNGALAAKSAVEIQGGSIEALTITENGTYTHAANGGYSPVTVNVEGGGDVEYIDKTFTLTSPISSGDTKNHAFQLSELAGKRIVSALIISSSSNPYACLLGLSRFNDPIVGTEWIYAIIYAYNGNTNSVSSVTVRFYYQ